MLVLTLFDHILLIGASLSEPHTSVIALQNACVCMSVCVREAIYRKFKLNGNEGTYTFQIFTCAEAF